MTDPIDPTPPSTDPRAGLIAAIDAHLTDSDPWGLTAHGEPCAAHRRAMTSVRVTTADEARFFGRLMCSALQSDQIIGWIADGRLLVWAVLDGTGTAWLVGVAPGDDGTDPHLYQTVYGYQNRAEHVELRDSINAVLRTHRARYHPDEE